MKSIPIKITLIAISLFFVSCTKMCTSTRKDLTPEEVVENYLTTSLSMSNLDEKKALLSFTTGNLFNVISTASDDLILNAFIKKKYDVKTFSILERKDRTPRETEITFILSYQNPEKDKAPETLATLSTENTVALTREKGAWWIRDVVGKKTTIDFPIDNKDVIRPDKE